MTWSEFFALLPTILDLWLAGAFVLMLLALVLLGLYELINRYFPHE